MKDLKSIISCLAQSPIILKGLIESIPPEQLKQQRKEGKWSIHENACHLSRAEIMIHERFKKFVESENPEFEPYLPGSTVKEDLLQFDLETELENFNILRKESTKLLRVFDNSIWRKKASHPEYTDYDARILARHTLMHDHFHMYRIEELWLTKNEYI